MAGSFLPYSGRKSMGLCCKAKLTGSLVQARIILPVLFALLVLSVSYCKQHPSHKQSKKGWKHWWTVGSVSVLHWLLLPRSKRLKLLLPLPRGEQWDWGQQEPFTFFSPLEIPLGLKGTQHVPLHPHLTQCTPVWKCTQTQIISFQDSFSCSQKHFKFPCINTKVTFESWKTLWSSCLCS